MSSITDPIGIETLFKSPLELSVIEIGVLVGIVIIAYVLYEEL